MDVRYGNGEERHNGQIPEMVETFALGKTSILEEADCSLDLSRKQRLIGGYRAEKNSGSSYYPRLY